MTCSQRSDTTLQKIKQDQTIWIYHSIFASHMTYGCQIWDHSPTNTYINKINVLQNNALRLITFDIQLKLLQIILKTLLLIHGYFNKKLPESFQNYFILDKDKHLYQMEDIRPTHIPDKFNDYILMVKNIQPQQNPIPGQLYRPEYETVRYGRDSLKYLQLTQLNTMN